MTRRIVLCLLGAFALLGCDGEGSLSLFVDLRTDFVPGVEFEEVVVQLEGQPPQRVTAARGDDFVDGVRVAELVMLSPGPREVTIQLIDANGEELVRRRVIVDHRRSLSIAVLMTRDCAVVSCPGPGEPGENVECVGGRCAPAECVTGTEPSCPDVECVAPADCDPVAACARADCVEGSCVSAEREGACAADEYCAPESGCVLVPELAMDAGMVDAGVLDAGAPDAGYDAGVCDESPCRLVTPQCGCGPGLVCQRTRGDDPFRECVPPGTADVAELCYANSDCGVGQVCVAGTGSVGVCTQYCTPAGTVCADPASFCGELFVTSEPIGACMLACDPVTPSGCPSPLGCTLLRTRSLETSSITWGALCNETGPAQGEACTGICAPGLICGSGDVCVEVCEIGGAACPGGRSCVAVSPRAALGGVEYGACE